MQREYIGTIYSTGGLSGGYGGPQYTEFTYYSSHRANSKANTEDAITQYRRIYGRSPRNITLLDTRLSDR